MRRFKIFFIREKAREEGFFKFSKLYYFAKLYSINIFNKKEKKELEESYKQSKRNKKERTTSEKLQEELEPLPPCPMSDE